MNEETEDRNEADQDRIHHGLEVEEDRIQEVHHQEIVNQVEMVIIQDMIIIIHQDMVIMVIITIIIMDIMMEDTAEAVAIIIHMEEERDMVDIKMMEDMEAVVIEEADMADLHIMDGM